jgi:D-3-phosphoglycerate dehydrogenase / 2-oxoglutarate reductase
MKVLISDKINEKSIDAFKHAGIEFDYNPDMTAYELESSISKYDALIVRSRTKVTSEIINRAEKLKIIGRVGSGVDTIDMAMAKAKEIVVVNAPDANSQAVAEHTVGLMLSILRKYRMAFLSMKEGLWLKKELSGAELFGKTVGIYGYGRIGQIVEKIVKAFGAEVLYYSRHYKNTEPNDLFAKSDIVTVHVPLTKETKGIINHTLLSKMKPSASFINTSRGEVVVEDDLYRILSEKRIVSAALDVFWIEPLPVDSKWRKLDNCLLTPHIAASTKEASIRGSDSVIYDVIVVLKGGRAVNQVI